MGQPFSKVLLLKQTPKTLLQLIVNRGQEKEKSLVTPPAKGSVAGLQYETVHDMQAVIS